MPDQYGNPTLQELQAMFGMAAPTVVPGPAGPSMAPLGTQDNPLDVFYGAGGTTGNKTTNKDLPQWLRDLGMKGDAYAGGMLKPEIRYGFKYKDGKIHFADGTSYEAKKVKDKKTKQVTYQYTDAQGNAKTYDPTDEQDAYNKKYQNATANQSVIEKLGATADRTQAHVHDIFKGAGNALQGKGSIFGGTPLGTKLSNAVTGRHDKPITDQYGGPTKESQQKYVDEHGQGALGYQPELHAVGSAIASYYAGNYAAGQLGQLGQAFNGAGAAEAIGSGGAVSGIGSGAGAGAGGASGGLLGGAGGATGGLGGASNGAAGISGAGGMGYGDWINTALNLYGAYQSAQGAKDSRNDLAKAMQQATTTLGGNTIVGPGGAGATLNPDGAGAAWGLGTDLEKFRSGLVGFGQGALTSASNMTGLPKEIQDALAGVTGASGLPGAPDTTGLQGRVDDQMLRSIFDMNRGSVAPGLQNQAFTGAAQQLGDASRGFGDVRDSTLANLRAQAEPFESRAYDTLQNDLFSTGRLGSSGGALQTEAFARGLGQADLSRQLAANNEARVTQQNALGIGQGLAGVGSGIAGLDDQLLQSAFSRFGQTAGLSQGLQQERFGNSVLLNNTGYDRANNMLQNQTNLAQLPMALQGSQLNLALQALNGQGALNDQGLQAFQAALAQSQAAANARIGSGSNVAALAGMRANLPTSSDIWGQVLTGIAGRTGNQNGNGSLGNILTGLFSGNNSAPKSQPQMYGGDPRAVGY